MKSKDSCHQSQVIIFSLSNFCYLGNDSFQFQSLFIFFYLQKKNEKSEGFKTLRKWNNVKIIVVCGKKNWSDKYRKMEALEIRRYGLQQR